MKKSIQFNKRATNKHKRNNHNKMNKNNNKSKFNLVQTLQ